MSLITDYYTQALKLFTLVISLLLLAAARHFVSNCSGNDTIEYLILMGFANFMMFILISSINILTTFLALEGLTIIIYVLSVFPYSRYNFEATLKYFYMSSLTSCLLLFACSIIYGLTGSFNFLTIKYVLYYAAEEDFQLTSTHSLVIVCILISTMFKIGAFPVHWWVSDIYESA